MPTGLIAAGLLSCAMAFAITPLTPTLTASTRTELAALLQRAGFPEVGESSVVIAITSVLGFDAKNGAFEYDLPYPQLPTISVTAQASAPQCAVVSARVRYGQPERTRRLRIDGTYCLANPAQWQSTNQTVAAE